MNTKKTSGFLDFLNETNGQFDRLEPQVFKFIPGIARALIDEAMRRAQTTTF